MKIVLSKEEIRQIILKHLEDKGFKIKPNSYTEISHIEGQYEESMQVFDGFSVEIEA